MSVVTLQGLSEQETRALLRYVDMQNNGALIGGQEKISVRSQSRGCSSTFALVINSPDHFPSDLFRKELLGIRSFRRSPPEREKEAPPVCRAPIHAFNI